MFVMFFLSFFFFLSPASLRRPSTDRRETLPHDWKLFRLDKFSPKIRGALPPQKKQGAKNMQNFGQFSTTSDFDRKYLRNGARYRKSERHVISSDSFRGELWSTNGLEFHVSLDPLKCTFLANYISAHRGCCALKFLHALEIDQALTAHTRSGTGFPQKNFNLENLKFGLKFSVLATITSGLVGVSHKTFCIRRATRQGS